MTSVTLRFLLPLDVLARLMAQTPRRGKPVLPWIIVALAAARRNKGVAPEAHISDRV
jgi:hypothetical protein